MPEANPFSGPNLFGGDTLLRTADNYRWHEYQYTDEAPEWKKIDTGHPFDSVWHDKNSRGIGLIDMLYAMHDNRPHRASAEMALHSIEVMDGILTSAKDGCFVEMTTTFERPAAVPKDYEDSLE